MQVAALLVFTFGAFAYGAVLAFWFRELGYRRWGTIRLGSPATTVDAPSWAMVAVSFVWFVTNVLQVIVQLAGRRLVVLELTTLWLAYFFPPLIMHVTLGEVARTAVRPPSRGWRLALWPVYAVSLGTAMLATLLVAGLVKNVPPSVDGWIMRIGLASCFIAAALFSGLLISRHRHAAETPRERQSHRSLLGLFALMLVIFLVSWATSDVPLPMVTEAALDLAARSLPLVFMFVSSYWQDRFGFFDLFVKRGLGLAFTITLLTAAFAILLPRLEALDASPLAPWVYALAMLPAVAVLPWLHSRVGAALDRWWLGRRYTTVEAVKRFVAGLRSATTEAQLVALAEAELTEIFNAPAAVRIGNGAAPAPPFEVVERAPVRSADAVIGQFLMGRRASEAPYFSEDLALLGTLADLFASVVQNVDLQRREQEKDRRARELSLHASRSELKALRAQINPHFLFNALNAIAGLIHRNPAVADETVEKLADVFRYALRGAESEWAVLDAELEFVRSYLDVERARFGDRLHTEVRADEDVRGARVPTMIVQTLVENAVKHGVSAVRGRAIVRVSARADGPNVILSVADNGSGFRNAAQQASRTEGGYGLANIRQRLHGYFGSSASLTVTRDEAEGFTVVSVSLPRLLHEPRPELSAAARSANEGEPQ